MAGQELRNLVDLVVFRQRPQRFGVCVRRTRRSKRRLQNAPSRLVQRQDITNGCVADPCDGSARARVIPGTTFINRSIPFMLQTPEQTAQHRIASDVQRHFVDIFVLIVDEEHARREPVLGCNHRCGFRVSFSCIVVIGTDQPAPTDVGEIGFLVGTDGERSDAGKNIECRERPRAFEHAFDDKPGSSGIVDEHDRTVECEPGCDTPCECVRR